MTLSTDPNALLQELDQVEPAIRASSQWLEALAQRRDDLVRVLDDSTRPVVVAARPAERTILRGLEYRGDIVSKWNYIDIHLDLLRRLWRDFPERREEMAAAMASRGTVRRYVAQRREDLFPGRPASWIQRYSVELQPGWYADTNLSTERMKVVLPAAVRASGLKWGSDVRVFWRRTVVPALTQ